MNRKQLLGLVILAVGIVLIFFAIDAFRQIHQAKNFADQVQNFFTNNPGWNPIITFFGGEAEAKLSDFNARAVAVLVTGIILCLAGITITIRNRPKK